VSSPRSTKPEVDDGVAHGDAVLHRVLRDLRGVS
jgi:hypothetical protein